MTAPTTPPTLAQVLRLLADLFDKRGSFSDALRQHAAALEAPARDAGREDSQRIVENFERLIKPTEPPAVARDAVRECKSCRGKGHYYAGKTAEGDPMDETCSDCNGTGKATEPPPPAPWDAKEFARQHMWERHGLRPSNLLDSAVLSKAGLFESFEQFAQAAYTAGQRAAGVQVPEEMPGWFPRWMTSRGYEAGNVDAQYAFNVGAWKELRTHLTQTREG
jgi:hypothetical protein